MVAIAKQKTKTSPHPEPHRLAMRVEGRGKE